MGPFFGLFWPILAPNSKLAKNEKKMAGLLESLLSKREALIAAATARVLSHFSVDEIYLPSTPRQALLAIVLVDAAVVKVVV